MFKVKKIIIMFQKHNKRYKKFADGKSAAKTGIDLYSGFGN